MKFDKKIGVTSALLILFAIAGWFALSKIGNMTSAIPDKYTEEEWNSLTMAERIRAKEKNGIPLSEEEQRFRLNSSPNLHAN